MIIIIIVIFIITLKTFLRGVLFRMIAKMVFMYFCFDLY